MPDFKHVDNYWVIQFQTAEESLEVERKLQLFLQESGTRDSAATERAVVWGPPMLISMKSRILYLSKGALQAAAAAGLTLPRGGQIQGRDLPERRSLIIGVQEDWG